jgi:hypothetical protein
MIEFMPESSRNIVGMRAGGRLTDADYKHDLIPRLQSLFNQHGKLRVLFFMDETFEGWDLQAAWDDASLGIRHRTDFEKIAIVGGPTWVEWCIKLAGFLMKGEIRTFRSDQLTAAWKWIRG